MADVAVTAPAGAGPLGVAGRKTVGAVRELGEIFLFFGRALWGMRTVPKHQEEFFRFAAYVALSTLPIVVCIAYFMGAECGLESWYSLKIIGVQDLGGVFNAFCDLRECIPIYFGFAVGAKVGCGLAAELGTMRISQEIDALQTLGINTIHYLVSTRILACLIVLPLLHVAALTSGFIASYVVQIFQIHQLSQGIYLDYFWRFMNPLDFVYSLVKAMSFALCTIMTGVFYGYNVRGGSAGVGRAAAKTTGISMIFVIIANAVFTQLFWGVNPRAPIP
ncbi:MAG: ABC transporter permease [Chloroflexi bacterium]|jgi:phospholipid/cholesterol/gamma-HCH transport system permease protein|nr:MAG: ABC transporter permease [Chloroflexota bacterium]TMD93980.1 MAG: ABC transporter permease [Chloroflexota bacterium]